MNERCKNCKINGSFEDEVLGLKSSLTTKQSLEHIENMNTKKDVEVQMPLREQALVENCKPYYNAEGMLILPLSWKDEDDQEEDEYWRKFNEGV